MGNDFIRDLLRVYFRLSVAKHLLRNEKATFNIYDLFSVTNFSVCYNHDSYESHANIVKESSNNSVF